ncbi:Ig-like domain-containing protein [Bdellovibrio bacteriovorus]|uniref:Ig-like domain-containing protein n=1 Tax=Bdellovibrio bacteriovorus TaxID=959 RepID=UPI003AA8CDEE
MARMIALFSLILAGCTLDAEMLRKMELQLKTPETILASDSADNINASPFTVIATFSESMVNFDAAAVSIINGTVSVTGSGKEYVLTVTPNASGIVSISIPASAALTADGYGNSPSNTLQRLFDDIAPVPPVVSNSVATADSTTSPEITWTAATDGHSGIKQYEIAVGSNSGTDDVVAWAVVTGHSKTFTGLTLTDGTPYYASIRVTDVAGNISTAVSGPAFSYHAPLTCPTGYSRVAAMAPYTTTDFCVMKYEAKNDGSGKAIPQGTGTPWVSVTRPQAVTACQLNGARYDLISNDEWQATARHITTVNANWSSGTAFVGRISRGHSDGTPASPLAPSTDDNQGCTGTGQTCSSTVWNLQRRTHVLPSGDVVWDMAGNAHEWVKGDYTNSASSYAVTMAGAIRNTFGPATNCDDITVSNDYCGYGKGSLFTAAGAPYPITRGGTATYQDSSGLFSTRLDPSETTVSSNFTFRCVYK